MTFARQSEIKFTPLQIPISVQSVLCTDSNIYLNTSQIFRETVFCYKKLVSNLIWMKLDSQRGLEYQNLPFLCNLAIPESFFDFFIYIACFLLAQNFIETLFCYKQLVSNITRMKVNSQMGLEYQNLPFLCNLAIPESFFDFFFIYIACSLLSQNFIATVFCYKELVYNIIWMKLDSQRGLEN